MNKIITPCELKTSDSGRFTGYASVFGNLDSGGDVILPGAFKEFVLAKNGKTVVFMAHNTRELPIGSAVVTQDAVGLKFDAMLIMEDPVAHRLYAHMKAGTISGMSIGYDILPGGAKILESGVRELSALRLWEISPVVFGMNMSAGIETVKDGERRFNSPKELEAYLRDVGDLSRSQAKAITACGYKGLSNAARDVPVLAANLERLTNLLADFGLKHN